jgi:hypothetical protein
MQFYRTEERNKESKRKIGNFFVLNLADMQDLIQKGIRAEELHAFLVLGAATDEGNTHSRAGRKAISAALGCGTRAADRLIQNLISLRAIESLEDQMANIRNPMASRFRLLQSISTDTETDTTHADNLVAIFNELPRTPDFRRAVVLAGMPAITALLDLSRDPCGSLWPPRLYAEIHSQELAKLGEYSLHFLSPDSLMRAVSKLQEQFSDGILALTTFGLVCYDLYAAASTVGNRLIAIDPIASLAHGLVDRSGPFAAVSDAVLTLKARLHCDTQGRPDEPNSTVHAESLMALLPDRIPAKKIILRARLKILPRDAETIAQEERLWADGQAAATRATGITMNIRSDMMVEGRSFPCKAAP